MIKANAGCKGTSAWFEEKKACFLSEWYIIIGFIYPKAGMLLCPFDTFTWEYTTYGSDEEVVYLNL